VDQQKRKSKSHSANFSHNFYQRSKNSNRFRTSSLIEEKKSLPKISKWRILSLVDFGGIINFSKAISDGHQVWSKTCLPRFDRQTCKPIRAFFLFWRTLSNAWSWIFLEYQQLRTFHILLDLICIFCQSTDQNITFPRWISSWGNPNCYALLWRWKERNRFSGLLPFLLSLWFRLIGVPS